MLNTQQLHSPDQFWNHQTYSYFTYHHWGGGTPPKLAANLGFRGFRVAAPPRAGVDSLLKDPLPLLPIEEEELLRATLSKSSGTLAGPSTTSFSCSTLAACFTVGFTDFLTTLNN